MSEQIKRDANLEDLSWNNCMYVYMLYLFGNTTDFPEDECRFRNPKADRKKIRPLIERVVKDLPDYKKTDKSVIDKKFEAFFGVLDAKLPLSSEHTAGQSEEEIFSPWYSYMSTTLEGTDIRYSKGKFWNMNKDRLKTQVPPELSDFTPDDMNPLRRYSPALSTDNKGVFNFYMSLKDIINKKKKELAKEKKVRATYYGITTIDFSKGDICNIVNLILPEDNKLPTPFPLFKDKNGSLYSVGYNLTRDNIKNALKAMGVDKNEYKSLDRIGDLFNLLNGYIEEQKKPSAPAPSKPSAPKPSAPSVVETPCATKDSYANLDELNTDYTCPPGQVCSASEKLCKNQEDDIFVDFLDLGGGKKIPIASADREALKTIIDMAKDKTSTLPKPSAPALPKPSDVSPAPPKPSAPKPSAPAPSKPAVLSVVEEESEEESEEEEESKYKCIDLSKVGKYKDISLLNAEINKCPKKTVCLMDENGSKCVPETEVQKLNVKGLVDRVKYTFEGVSGKKDYRIYSKDKSLVKRIQALVNKLQEKGVSKKEEEEEESEEEEGQEEQEEELPGKKLTAKTPVAPSVSVPSVAVLTSKPGVGGKSSTSSNIDKVRAAIKTVSAGPQANATTLVAGENVSQKARSCFFTVPMAMQN